MGFYTGQAAAAEKFPLLRVKGDNNQKNDQMLVKFNSIKQCYNYDLQSCVDTQSKTLKLAQTLNKVIDNNPILPYELDAVIDTMQIQKKDDLLKMHVPEQVVEMIDSFHIDDIMQSVKSIVSDRDFFSDVVQKIQFSKAKHQNNIQNTPPKDLDSNNSQQWNKLRQKYFCVICRDLISYPVILDCGDTFCGSCIQSYVQRCESDDIEITHNCPTCRKEFTKLIFERMLDREIQSEFDNMDLCQDAAAFKDWEARRHAFDPSFLVPRSRSSGAPYTQTAYQQDSYNEHNFWYVTFFLAAVVVGVITATRAASAAPVSTKSPL